MEIGTADLVEDIKSSRVKRTGSTGGGSGDGGRNPGGNDENPNNSDNDERELFVPNKSKILTGFLLLVVFMTFAGLIAAYLVIYTNDVGEWKPFELPLPVWISTILIFTSSYIYHLGKLATDRNDQRSARKWFIVTTIIGAAFISSQLLAWVALNVRGLYMEGNPYAGFFYLLTAVHAVHVLGGIIALGAILLKSMSLTRQTEAIERRKTLAQVVGWYWHFMGVLWLTLVVLLGFWK